MIIHLFNSSSVSGPERLVLPALARFPGQFTIVNLREERIARLRESDPLEEYARSLKLPYYAVNVRNRWDRAAIKDLRRLVEKWNPSLCHTHGPKASFYLRQACPKRSMRRFPMVATHHGVRGLPDWKTRAYDWFFRRFILKSYDRLLSVSTEDYEFLLSTGFEEKRLRLHLNGIDGHRVDPEDRPRKSREIRGLWLADEPERDRLFLFGVVARLSAEKDHARIFHILSRLNSLSSSREWRCLIFGMGALETQLRQLAHRLGLERQIVWMGYRSTLPEELAGLDLLLSFSRAEGLPINMIEAGWRGPR